MNKLNLQDRLVSIQHISKTKAASYRLGMDTVVKARIKELSYETMLEVPIIALSLSILIDIQTLASNDYIPAQTLLNSIKRNYFADSFNRVYDVVVLIADAHAEVVS